MWRSINCGCTVNISKADFVRKKNKHLLPIHKWIQEHGGDHTTLPRDYPQGRQMAESGACGSYTSRPATAGTAGTVGGLSVQVA